jgi:hypothetical protein
VKYCLYSLLLTGLAIAQSTAVLLTPDLNGRNVEAAIYTAKDGDRTQLIQSINGRLVPLQKSETRVLSEGPNERTTETVMQKYDGTGQLASTERTVVEEQKRANGAVVHATIYRSDLNGHLQESEHRTIESQTQGNTSTSDVTISRVGLGGSFAVAEKRNIVTVTEPNSVKETEVVQRPAQNGQLVEATREIREQTKAGDKLIANTARYEPDYSGKMSLIRQQLATTTKAADGSAVTERNVYAPSAYGIAREEHTTPRLQEQELIVRKEKKGVVTETTTVSRPLLADPNRLGPSTTISDVVCTGKCEGPLQP